MHDQYWSEVKDLSRSVEVHVWMCLADGGIKIGWMHSYQWLEEWVLEKKKDQRSKKLLNHLQFIKFDV